MDKQNNLATLQYAKDSNDVLFNKGKTFYWAKFFLSKHAAQQATRLYRFCRHIDDLADETQDKAEAARCLNKAKAELISGVSSDLIINDGIILFIECNISIQIPIELINGVLADLDFVRIKTEADLIEYCYQVAGTVGIMMCKVLNVHSPHAIYHAIDLGIGMQLTNICRDIHADALLDRVYLPASMIGNTLEPKILGSNIILNEADRNRTIQVATILLKNADHYYRSGYLGLAHLPIRSRISILIAAKLYQQIGIEMKRKKFKEMHKKVYVPLYLKLLITIKALCSAAFDASFWCYRTTHDIKLHRFITRLPYCHTYSVDDSGSLK